MKYCKFSSKIRNATPLSFTKVLEVLVTAIKVRQRNKGYLNLKGRSTIVICAYGIFLYTDNYKAQVKFPILRISENTTGMSYPVPDRKVCVITNILLLTPHLEFLPGKPILNSAGDICIVYMVLSDFVFKFTYQSQIIFVLLSKGSSKSNYSCLLLLLLFFSFSNSLLFQKEFGDRGKWECHIFDVPSQSDNH